MDRWPVPDIPGTPVSAAPALQRELCAYFHREGTSFPGSQPVSFVEKSLASLKEEEFWVCEKSDGVRVLVFVHTQGDVQDVYLIGRANDWHKIADTNFHAGKELLKDSVFDGELVIDIDPATKKETLNLYLFDGMALDSKSYVDAPFEKRYTRMREYITYHKHAASRHPEYARNLPFGLKVKEQASAYRLQTILDAVPKLTHGNDGLIFTNKYTAYIPGTDANIIKWKPAEENSIDVRLRLKFPPSATDAAVPDFSQAPLFLLYVGGGSRGPVYFDAMTMSGAEWERWCETRQQLDDQIGEVAWSTDKNDWTLLRLRHDKADPNYVTVAHSIVNSIRESVSAADLAAASKKIEAAHRFRERRQALVRQLHPYTDPFVDRRLKSSLDASSVVHSLVL